MNKEHYPDVADMIFRNTYVDDILKSVDTFIEALELIRNTEHVLSLGGFKVKHWIISGKVEKNEVQLLDTNEEKILGLMWNPKEDKFLYTVGVIFSKKYRKVRTGPDMTKIDIEENFPAILSRRMILSQTASIYDPLGLVIPFTLKAKILMRDMVMQEVNDEGGSFDWDEPLPETYVLKWKSFFCELYELQSLTFSRCLCPSGVVGKPVLVMFSDGSKNAYGTCAYISWELECGKYECRLLIAKNRIAPKRQL